jgi:hypothetical protein
MASTDAYINYVLDRSGSMAAIWQATVGGFNAYKNEQAEEEGDAWITLTAFDAGSGGTTSPKLGHLLGYLTRGMKPAVEGTPQKNVNIEVVFDSVKAADCPDLKNQVVPRGMTPLLDAIGLAIENTEDWVVSNKDFDGKVFVVINTDGMENASEEFTLDAVKGAIEIRQKEGWEFIFMGAGIDAFGEASKLGISRQSTTSYNATPMGAVVTNSTLSTATSNTRRGGGPFNWDNVDNDAPEAPEEETHHKGTPGNPPRSVR